jgi:hypothetical protein
MFVAAHRARPRPRARRQILVFTRDPGFRLWVEHETFGEHVSIELVDALADVVTSLTLVPPPWPGLLIVDVDALPPDEVNGLAAIRDAGWPGIALAVGDAPAWLQRSLSTDVILPRTLKCELLRNALVTQLGLPMRRSG